MATLSPGASIDIDYVLFDLLKPVTRLVTGDRSTGAPDVDRLVEIFQKLPSDLSHLVSS